MEPDVTIAPSKPRKLPQHSRIDMKSKVDGDDLSNVSEQNSDSRNYARPEQIEVSV